MIHRQARPDLLLSRRIVREGNFLVYEDQQGRPKEMLQEMGGRWQTIRINLAPQKSVRMSEDFGKPLARIYCYRKVATALHWTRIDKIDQTPKLNAVL